MRASILYYRTELYGLCYCRLVSRYSFLDLLMVLECCIMFKYIWLLCVLYYNIITYDGIIGPICSVLCYKLIPHNLYRDCAPFY